MKNDAKKKLLAKYCLVMLFTILLGLVGQITGPAVPAAEAQVVPVGPTSGAEYGEWSARWWQWALSIPLAVNPVADTTGENCGQGQVGNVWFLAGSFGSDPVTRRCTIPAIFAGKPIFFPVINVAVSEPFPNETIIDIRMQAAAIINQTSEMTVTIDGLTLNTAQLLDFRVQSPVFQVLIPNQQAAGQRFLFPRGLHPTSVADGYWLYLTPLSPGRHTITIDAVNNLFQQHVTYDLTVQQ